MAVPTRPLPIRRVSPATPAPARPSPTRPAARAAAAAARKSSSSRRRAARLASELPRRGLNFRGRSEEVLLVAQARGQASERAPEAGVELRGEEREHEATDAVAGKGEVGVRAIDHERQAPLGQEPPHVGARHAEQRPEEPAAGRAHATEPPAPRAAQETEAERP